MTKDEALQIVSNLMLVVQKERSNTNELFDNLGWNDEIGEQMKADLCKWTQGPQGEKFLLMLADLSTGVKSLDGPTFYNLMIIANQLEPSLALLYILRWDEELPAPDPGMLMWF